ncbi:DUF4145 domain-containing protein [Burkholderia ubonensis]|uniref:DUF4145 domain-containing protein n=1 Tax=Burkholderia ubonensis TaxID=101571 RepID=UPI0012F85DEB|nr:DUF4145 domain-containing protein [Burkholderia ubonensis]
MLVGVGGIETLRENGPIALLDLIAGEKMAEVSERKIVKVQCPHCNGERTCEVHGFVDKQWDWSDDLGNSVHGGTEHSLLECKGCETVFYESSSWNSEDVDHWYAPNGEMRVSYFREKNTYPKPESRTKPMWFDTLYKVDEPLHKILGEMYVAYDNRTLILAAIGLRTALDRATEVLGIDPAMKFVEKMAALREGGWIGDTEKEILEVVTNAGNAAAHRGWEPDEHEAAHLLMAMEVFLQRAFVVGKSALSINERIPPAPKRRA